MENQKEKIEAAYPSYRESVEHAQSECLTMLPPLESRLERTYSRALRDLRHLRHLYLDARKKDGEKRTESQERTPTADPWPALAETQFLSTIPQSKWVRDIEVESTETAAVRKRLEPVNNIGSEKNEFRAEIAIGTEERSSPVWPPPSGFSGSVYGAGANSTLPYGRGCV